MDNSSLESFELSLSVGDLEVPEGVEVLVASDVGVATVDAPRLTIEGEEEEGEEDLEGEEGEEVEGEEGAESPAEGADDES